MIQNKKSFFIIKKENDKESTGENSFENKNDIIFPPLKYSFQDFCFQMKNNDYNSNFEEQSLSRLFSNEEEEDNLTYQNIQTVELKLNNDISDLLFNNENNNEISFKKNRNNLNNNLINVQEKDIEENTNNNPNNKTIRCDSLLIKFKAALGKWFIKAINNKIKILKSSSVIKRSIKFYSFNYKKFTLKVSYNQNKEWLGCKMKDLLLLGDEDNQIKNEKALSSLYKKDLIEFKEIKDMLESSYEDIIYDFYKSDDFVIFKEDKKVKELNDNFCKIMGISLLDKNGFVEFIEKRKGNVRKEK